MRNLISALAILQLLLTIQPATAGEHSSDLYYDVRTNTSAERAIGAVTIHLVGTNPFRDNVIVTASPTPIAPTDPSSIFSPLLSFTPSAKSANSKMPVNQLGESIVSLVNFASLSSWQSETLTRPMLAAVSPINPCDKFTLISTTTLPSCLGDLTSRSNVVQIKLTHIFLEMQWLVGTVDILLAYNTDINEWGGASASKPAGSKQVQSHSGFSQLVDDVVYCIYRVACPVVLPKIDDIDQTSGAKSGQITAVTIAELVNDIIDVSIELQGVQSDFQRISISALGFENAQQKDQVSAISSRLATEQQVIQSLQGYNRKVLQPLNFEYKENTGLDAQDGPIASAFQTVGTITCRALLNSGVTNQLVFNVNSGVSAAGSAPSPTPIAAPAATSDQQGPTIAVQPSTSGGKPTSGSTAQGGANAGSANASGIKAGGAKAGAANAGSATAGGPNASSTTAMDQGSGTTKSVSTTRHYDISLVCPPSVFLSTGVGISSLSSPSYVAINDAANNKEAQIEQSTHGPAPVVLQLAHFSINYDNWGGGPALTAGLGLDVQGSSTIEPTLLGGFSYAVKRSVALTAGVAFGGVNVLPPGYTVGGSIAPGSKPPTLTSYRAGAFFSLTFITGNGSGQTTNSKVSSTTTNTSGSGNTSSAGTPDVR